jgi:hypothetical protein
VKRNLLGVSACVFLFVTTISAEEQPFSAWKLGDYSSHGEVVAGPEGEAHGRLELRSWSKLTLVDLRKSKFLANEDGPFSSGELPKAWPAGDAFQQLGEASQDEKYPVSLKGGPEGVCVLGGSVVGTQPRELPWRFMKKCYDGDAVHIESAGPMVVDGLYSENVEDTFGPRGGGYRIIRNAYAKYLRDDFVENDGLLSGEIDDCLVEGAHVFISARPGRQAAERAYAAKKDNPPHVRVRNTLVHIPPMPYDGDMKLADQDHIVDGMSGGKLFKWSPAGGTLDVADCVFRLDMMSPNGPKSMSFPGGTYKNVTLVWLGDGNYPAPLPEGVTVTRDVSVWEKARAAWIERHSRRE